MLEFVFLLLHKLLNGHFGLLDHLSILLAQLVILVELLFLEHASLILNLLDDFLILVVDSNRFILLVDVVQ